MHFLVHLGMFHPTFGADRYGPDRLVGLQTLERGNAPIRSVLLAGFELVHDCCSFCV